MNQPLSTRARRWAGDLAAIAILLLAIALVVVGASALFGLLGPGCRW